jgi:nucleotide-binding universal stress UspA family protein
VKTIRVGFWLLLLLKGYRTDIMEMHNQSNTILIALDGSPTAKTAAKIAVRIAQWLHYQIRGLYVVDISLVEDPYKDKQLEAQRTADEWSSQTTLEMLRRQGDEALTWLEEVCLLEGTSLSADIKLGGIPELVIEEGEKSGLVSLGRRGFTHAEEQDKLGPSFMSIAHYLRKPMLVGGDEPLQQVDRLLVAYNGSKQSQIALHWSACLQRSLGAEISLLAIEERETDPVESWLEDAQERLRAEKATAETFIHRGQPASAIVAAAVEHRSDLILLGHDNLRPFLEWLIGSTVDRVLRQTQLPVLLA